MVSELDPVLKAFTVDLQRPTKEFDPDRFDQNAKALHLNSIPTYTSRTPRSELKYIVEGDLMLAFRQTLEHKTAYINLYNILQGLNRIGKLQSAGFIIVVYSADLQTTLSRVINGVSSSLPLDPRSSNIYRETVLKTKLGEFFRI